MFLDVNIGVCNGHYSSILCMYPGLVPPGGFQNPTGWIFQQHGQLLSCLDFGGSIVIGICGSGRNLDCSGGSSHGIRCANHQDFYIDQNSCNWARSTHIYLYYFNILNIWFKNINIY